MQARTGVLTAALLTASLLLAAPGLAQQRTNSQVQVARQFWLAAIGQEWRPAYRWLTPAARATTSPQQFRHSIRQLRDPVRRFGPVIDLYKLGFRLRETAVPETFVTYSFRTDTLAARPHFQLHVSFQDSAARQVQSFRVVQRTSSP
ncbi:hypothetical protein [Hymenobacter lapidiphilus]|uniref:DUF4019 domain-containing protein n=1 Tax=Hymenobacter lapidiphilus TaxID=2608003 RepID=A0A7Y7PMS4_9BACT|nr:hypothetical protein [Hymenobacter lapidiphilus]NVO30700.1 hypothetical protein [Hymenobacter lapidiphilus]